MNREGKLWKKISSAPLIKFAGGGGEETIDLLYIIKGALVHFNRRLSL